MPDPGPHFQPDPIAVWLDGTQYAKDSNGNQINATGPYLQSPDAIFTPNSDTSYYSSSPPLLFSIAAIPVTTHTMVIAICDALDEQADSALMINIGGCDIDTCPPEIKINYVTTTTTLGAGVSGYTSTIQAIHTTSGTFIIGVEGSTSADITTIQSSTTTSAEQTTTNSQASTPTSDATTISSSISRQPIASSSQTFSSAVVSTNSIASDTSIAGSS